MEYEQFFQNDKCECVNYSTIRIALLSVTLLSLLFDCTGYCRNQKKIVQLETENKSLKSIILKSIDNTIMKFMKNGNDTVDDKDE
jgi:hypothetical protein